MSRSRVAGRPMGSRIVAVVLCLSLITSPSLTALAQTAGQETPTATPTDSVPKPVPTATTLQPPAPQPSEFFHGGVKFLGGPGFPDLKGKETWDNNLTLFSGNMVCEFKDNAFLPIQAPLARVTSISYGQASSRHAGRWVTIGVLLAPIAVLGLFHKSRKHNVLISWTDESGQERGAFMEVKKDNLRRLLNSLTFRTGKPVYADAKDRKWLMTEGVQAVPDPTENQEEKK